MTDTGPAGVSFRGGAENKSAGQRRRTTKRFTDPILTGELEGLAPGKALDLACGSGRHALWLAERGWDVTALDLVTEPFPGVHFIRADLESHEYQIEPDTWDLIVCWLYWQPDLLPEILHGTRSGGVVALSGKTNGRFATSLEDYRRAFAGWIELASGEDESRTYFVARRPEELVH
jgi:SAM-dependent methyltransferase